MSLARRRGPGTSSFSKTAVCLPSSPPAGAAGPGLDSASIKQKIEANGESAPGSAVISLQKATGIHMQYNRFHKVQSIQSDRYACNVIVV